MVKPLQNKYFIGRKADREAGEPSSDGSNVQEVFELCLPREFEYIDVLPADSISARLTPNIIDSEQAFELLFTTPG